MGLSRYWGLLGARNWELIQPFKPVFSTWTQSPSRLVAVNRVPLGALPRTGAFPEGADLMFTPGRCKKTKSRFCAAEVVWGVTALGATWGEVSASEAGGTTPDAPRDGSGTVGAGCTGVAAIEEDSVVSAGTFAPGEARKKYVSPATPNAAMIAVPAISFRRAPNVSYRSLGSRGWKESSPPIAGRKVSSRRRSCPSSRRSIWGQRGRPNLVWRVQPALSKAVSVGPYVGNIYGCHASPNSAPAVFPFAVRRTARTTTYVALTHWPKGWRPNDSRTALERFIDGQLLEFW